MRDFAECKHGQNEQQGYGTKCGPASLIPRRAQEETLAFLQLYSLLRSMLFDHLRFLIVELS
jgi:hypothetical protein